MECDSFYRRVVRSAPASEVIEIAPSIGLPDTVRQALARRHQDRADQLRQRGHRGFLFDQDTNEWFFIEMNPSQIEHTVTEVITGIDQCGPRFSPLGALAPRSNRFAAAGQIPRGSCAVQCRITTEAGDKFLPDYGKILTYRSAGGWRAPGRWHRLRRRGHHTV
jgi:pyruvate carboxylase